MQAALGTLKTRDWKMQDWKTRDQIAWVEIAGLENGGPVLPRRFNRLEAAQASALRCRREATNGAMGGACSHAQCTQNNRS